MNLYQKMVVGITDVLVLAELCACIYFANLTPDDFTALFMKYFGMSIVPTVLLALFMARKLRSVESEA